MKNSVFKEVKQIIKKFKCLDINHGKEMRSKEIKNLIES